MQRGVEHRFEHVDAQGPFLDGAAARGAEALALDEDVGRGWGEGQEGASKEGVGVRGVGGGVEGFFLGFLIEGGGGGGRVAAVVAAFGNVDPGPVFDFWGYLSAGGGGQGFLGGEGEAPGGGEGEVAVSEVADPHVDAEDAVAMIVLFGGFGGRGRVFGEVREDCFADVGDQNGFGAAAVGSGCAGDGFELLELAGTKPVEAGCHPLSTNELCWTSGEMTWARRD